MGKDKKKKKKKSSKHSRDRSRRKSNSASSSCSEDEWVELEQSSTQPTTSEVNKTIQGQSKVTAETEKKVHEKELHVNSVEQDDWLKSPSLFACVSAGELRQARNKKKDKNEYDKFMLDKLGQTDRELNPYWKDGGSGLPSENPVCVDSLKQASATVGDQGAAWLRKALQRAKEQAAERGCSLELVVSERWGSLEKLENMIAEAEERDRTIKRVDSFKYKKEDSYSRSKFEGNKSYQPKEKYHNYKSEKNDEYVKDQRKSFARPAESDEDDVNESRTNNKCKEPKYDYKRSRYKSNEKSDSNKMFKGTYNKYEKQTKRESSKKSSSSDDDSPYERQKSSGKKKSRNKHYKKPKSSESSSEDERKNIKKYHKTTSYKKNENRSFVKPHHDSEDEYSLTNKSYSDNYKSYSGKGWKKKTELKECKNEISREQEIESKCPEETNKKTEEVSSSIEESVPILTDKEMNELGAKLVKAELLGNKELVEQLKAKLEKSRMMKANQPKETKQKEEIVILTHTDSKGFTRPVSFEGAREPTRGRRKGKKVETHSGGKRMRYFADDDKYSLQEMFQREKLDTVEDSNAVFAKLASKGIGRDGSARDMEDVFEETARVEEVDGKKQARGRQHAIEQSKRTARSLENCKWCLESQHMLKHLIIHIGKTCYLCVPPYQSLTENHCLIVPTCHTPCATQLDEDVWREMQDFRKSVVQMFQAQDLDVVFFETARNLNQFPHMTLNCVPMPKETGDLAPIYFKKAIQECEMEWSNNKKLVDLKGRDVRRAVPKGLPYFFVDFGMDSGFAHVIEDERLFPANFAQETIGGMLDLDHMVWRKQRKQTFEEQSKKVIQLAKLWSSIDMNKPG